MKNSVKRLLEGSPSRFFDDIRAKLDEKTSTIVESVASTVADTVFTEAKADRDENHVVVDNKNIQANIQNKKPEKIKKLKGDLAEDVETLEELTKATLGRYVKKATKDAQYHAYHIGKKQGGDKTPEGRFPQDHERSRANRESGVKKAVDKLVYKNEEIEPVAEDMGAHTISTKHGGKNGKSFQTFVVNKKRVSKEGSQRKWADMIKKATPKETEWDKHTKQ
jgi:hypothetical protein